jgi:hypothetical protein
VLGAGLVGEHVTNVPVGLAVQDEPAELGVTLGGGTIASMIRYARDGRSLRPRLFLVWVITCMPSVPSVAKAKMNRATSLNAPEAVISEDASVLALLLKVEIGDPGDHGAGPVGDPGERVKRAADLAVDVGIERVADGRHERVHRHKCHPVPQDRLLRSLLSAGRLRVSVSSSAVSTSARYTLVKSALAAMSRGTIVNFQESSTAT